MKLLEMLKASIVSLQSGSVAAIFKGGTTCMFNYHCEFTVSQTWMICLKVRINWAQSRANLTWNINIHMQAPSCHHPTVPFPVEPLVPAPRPGASKKTRPSPTLKQSCSVLHGGFQKDGRVLETAPLHSCFPTVEVADHRGPSKMAGTYQKKWKLSCNSQRDGRAYVTFEKGGQDGEGWDSSHPRGKSTSHGLVWIFNQQPSHSHFPWKFVLESFCCRRLRPHRCRISFDMVKALCSANEF